MNDRRRAKAALDAVIRKSRVHLYKPIQIAEILYRHRTKGGIDLLSLEDYRVRSRTWRDEMCRVLLGRVCTSSARFQDDLFNENAIPPRLLALLGAENQRTNGAVEAYIYRRFTSKHSQLADALDYCLEATRETFCVKTFLDSFWNEPGLRRSLDKIYEIVVYALFSTLVEALDLQVQVSVGENALPLLQEFEDFSQKALGLDSANHTHTEKAHVYRVGVTNAADRGLDMYSNWGPAIQIKHLSLDEELAKDIVSGVSSDRVVIVCKDAQTKVISSLLTRMGWRSQIQSIITESDLINWYEKALRGPHSDQMGEKLIARLCAAIGEEFPLVDEVPQVLKDRHYEAVGDPFWA